VVLTALVLMRNFGGSFATRMVGAVSALGVALAVAVGLAPVFARFGVDATQDTRTVAGRSCARRWKPRGRSSRSAAAPAPTRR
jgi:hypothetical protein